MPLNNETKTNLILRNISYHYLDHVNEAYPIPVQLLKVIVHVFFFFFFFC